MSYNNKEDIDKLMTKALEAKILAALDAGVNGSYAEKVKDRVVKRTQLGTGVDPNTGSSEKLKALSANYKEMRQGKARWYTSKSGAKIKVMKEDAPDWVKKPDLASTTTPAKSNLTATGQLLKSLRVVRSKVSEGIQFIISIDDKRGPGLFGYPAKIGNKELVGILAAQGRKFFGFTKSQKNEISNEIRQIIIKLIK